MVRFGATLALNSPDLARNAKDQKAQIRGQMLGLPTTMTLYSFIGVAVTSASVLIFGQTIWDPVVLLSRLGNPFVILISLFALLVATITTNVAANVVGPANDFANLWPSRITFAIGGVLTGILGIVIMPWRLLSDYGTYIFGWLVGYSSFLGPIAGILIADYFLIRKRRLNVIDLYLKDGEYRFTNGFNIRALVALACGIVIALIGLLIQ